MNKDVSVTLNNEQVDEKVDELGEDKVVIGPGEMLREARKKLSLSDEDISDKLNFRKRLVAEIEQDIFDSNLPATFNRGYLRSYAKLVHIDADEVLNAYDKLGNTEVPCSEMQSYSNLTEKQAQHSRLMWISYLIVAILFALMVLWWWQSPEASSPNDITGKIAQETASPVVVEAVTKSSDLGQTLKPATQARENEQLMLTNSITAHETPAKTDEVLNVSASEHKVTEQVELIVQSSAQDIIEAPEPNPELSTAVFTFSGDCWVNIYDDTGERIAWGVKKSGYIMSVSGQAPLQVTLGKPELATIVFDGQMIDLSSFNPGNIAKFSLPLSL